MSKIIFDAPESCEDCLCARKEYTSSYGDLTFSRTIGCWLGFNINKKNLEPPQACIEEMERREVELWKEEVIKYRQLKETLRQNKRRLAR